MIQSGSVQPEFVVERDDGQASSSIGVKLDGSDTECKVDESTPGNVCRNPNWFADMEESFKARIINAGNYS